MDAEPDTDRLLAALRRLGADHEPDVPALRRRIDRRQRPAAAGRTARSTRSVALLPAAAVLLVAGGMVLVATIGVPGPDPARQPQPTSVGGPAIGTPSNRPSPTPTPSGSSVGQSRPRPTSSADATGTSGTPSPTVGPPNVAGPLATAEIETVSNSSNVPVQLDSTLLLDWLAIGARSDLTVVRAKKAAAETILEFDQPAGVTAVPGPFRVSWIGGLPEQDHTAAETWLRRPGTAGLSVSVAASPRPRTVLLAAGAGDLAASVQVSGGAVLAPTSLGAGSPTPQGFLITVRLPATISRSVIHVGGTATGDRPQVFLSAVAADSEG